MTPNRLAPTLPRWIIVLIVLCSAIEGILLLAALVGYPSVRQVAYFLGGFWSPVLWQGQGIYPLQPVVMFLTYGLLHGGIMHLAMNMISLAVVARELARFVGPARMALIYFATQIAAGLLFAVMAPTGGPMVGASGAIFGLAGALIGQAIIWRRGRGMTMRPVWRAVLIIGGLNIALTILLPTIAWEAHLGGALAGLILGLLLPVSRDRVPKAL